MRLFKSLSLEKRNDVLQSLYVGPLSSSVVDHETSADDAGLFTVDMELFGSQLLVTINRLSSDEASIELVRRC